MPQFRFVFNILLRAFWALLFLGVLSILLALAIFLYPELLAYLVSFGLIVLGVTLIIFAFWLRKYAKVDFGF